MQAPILKLTAELRTLIEQRQSDKNFDKVQTRFLGEALHRLQKFSAGFRRPLETRESLHEFHNILMLLAEGGFFSDPPVLPDPPEKSATPVIAAAGAIAAASLLSAQESPAKSHFSKELLAWARSQTSEKDIAAGLKEIQESGGSELGTFLPELEEIVHNKK